MNQNPSNTPNPDDEEFNEQPSETNAPENLEDKLKKFISGLSSQEEQMLKTVTSMQLDRMRRHLRISGGSATENLPQTDDEICEMITQYRTVMYMQMKEAYESKANTRVARLPEKPEDFPLPVVFGANIKDAVEASKHKLLREQVKQLLMMDEDELNDFVGDDDENLHDVLKCADTLDKANMHEVYKTVGAEENEVDTFELPEHYKIELESVDAKTAVEGSDGTIVTEKEMQDIGKDILAMMQESDEDEDAESTDSDAPRSDNSPDSDNNEKV